MINKKVFEDALIAGMHKELVKNATQQDRDNLGNAVDYLNSAIDILEESGMKAQADKVLNVLKKIANNNVKKMPNLDSLKQKGVDINDIKKAVKGDVIARAKVNTALRELDFSDKEIAGFVGANNYMDAETSMQVLDPQSSYGRTNEWLKDPYMSTDSVDMSDMDKYKQESFKSSPQDLVFKSLGFDELNAKHHIESKKDSKLTSEKMIENLKHHGTVFNMNDSNKSDDLLNADLGEDPLESHEDQETFEETD